MTKFIDHSQVCELVRAHVAADGGDPIWVGQNSRYPDYQYALRHDLITQEQHDLAKSHYGRLWNYAGD